MNASKGSSGGLTAWVGEGGQAGVGFGGFVPPVHIGLVSPAQGSGDAPAGAERDAR